MRRRSSSSGVRFDRLPLDFSARSRTSRRSSGESRFQYFRPSVFNQRIAARTLRHGTFRTAVMACKTQLGIGVVVTTPHLERVTATDSPPCREDERSRGETRKHARENLRDGSSREIFRSNRDRKSKRTAHRGLCEECGAPFTRTRPQKRFCSERCQRIAERRRYRARHTEQARCPQCGDEFTRSATTKRAQVFCSRWCMRTYRRADYRRRGIRPPGRPEAGAPAGGRVDHGAQ